MAIPYKFLALDHVVLRVRDVAKVQKFYCDALGCTVDKIQAQFGLTQLRAGRSLIDLIDIEGPIGKRGGAPPGAEARNMEHFCLRVEPFDEAAIVAHLQKHGVEIGQSGRRYGADGYGPSIYVSDPEGNVVELKGPPET
ncbi:MAG: VOC family protein [Alphaproteobacteria bacterium]